MGYRILIVDDSATVRAMIKRAIGAAGIPADTILEASDGRAGLDVLSRERVDLVLADLNMPVMTGTEMIERMMADPALKTIPVVVVSADPNRETAEALRNAGVRACLSKPFTPEQIRDLVGPILEPAHAER